MNSPNQFRDGACIRTPWGFRVHYSPQLNFCLCPDDAAWASEAYRPANVAHWLVTEAWDEIFQSDWTQTSVELPAQGDQ